MEPQSLILLDTDHIKEYVFGTNTLKEIRGASSLLDHLNRDVMTEQATSLGGERIYANGGSGLFLIATEKAAQLGITIQQEYQRQTGGGASITYAIQPLPADAPDTREAIMIHPMPHTLALLHHRLRAQKDHPHHTASASHPLMRPCDSCGVFYAATFASNTQAFYCQSCRKKQGEDARVKNYITAWIKQPEAQEGFKSPLWNDVLKRLKRHYYRLPDDTDRPEDLNFFKGFRQGKGYLGLIYADANGMGKKLSECVTLQQTQDFADTINDAVYDTMSKVIKDLLPVKESKGDSIFPFDILLIGGDDLVLVTPAAQAMHVAAALAEQFYTLANQEGRTQAAEKHSFSVGVVLAPTNYPFSLLLNLVEDTLKFAKKDGAKTTVTKGAYGKTRINFLVVAGSTSQSFEKVYEQLHRKNKEPKSSFYATMRPYTLERLKFLLTMLQEGNQHALGRSKLHQLREAILQRNLSSSVTESLAVLRGWQEDARNFVVNKVYSTEQHYPLAQWDEEDREILFPVVTFPWVVDTTEKNARRYSTLLLDFVELYDFVAGEGRDEYDEN